MPHEQPKHLAEVVGEAAGQGWRAVGDTVRQPLESLTFDRREVTCLACLRFLEGTEPHKVRVHDRGGCCDDHPSQFVAFCEDCDETVGGGDWSSANDDAHEHSMTHWKPAGQ